MNKKMFFTVLFFTVLGVVSAYAGTTDTLGMQGTYDKITGILTDKYLNPIFVISLLGIGIYQWVKGGGIFIALIFGALGMIISELKTIADALAGAMII